MYYHGTSIEGLSDILPPDQTGKISEKGRKKNLSKVFFTKDRGLARVYAGRYAGRAKNSLGGNPVVYIVEPVGNVEVISDRHGASVYMADAARVVKAICPDRINTGQMPSMWRWAPPGHDENLLCPCVKKVSVTKGAKAHTE